MSDNLISAALDSFLMTKDDIIADACETAMDAVFDNVSIPLVKYLKPLGKAALALRERNLLRNTIYYLQGFQTGNVDRVKLQEYKDRLRTDTAFCEKEISRILILLDSSVEMIRAKVIGCLFMHLVNGRITHSEFCEFCELSNRMYSGDFNSLYQEVSELEEYRFDRMATMGLAKEELRYKDENSNGNIVYVRERFLTRFGIKYRDLLRAVVKEYV